MTVSRERTSRWAMLAVGLLLAACGHGPRYAAPEEPRVVGKWFGGEDLLRLAEGMVDDLLRSDILRRGAPVVRVTEVENRTHEHVDVKSITDALRTRLVRSGRFRFATDLGEGSVRRVLDDERREGEVSGRYDPATVPAAGRMVAPRYHLLGALASHRTSEARDRELSYWFTLNLVNVETGLVDWSHEVEVTKRWRRGLVGR